MLKLWCKFESFFPPIQNFVSMNIFRSSRVAIVTGKFIELMTSKGQSADHWHHYHLGIKYSLKSYLITFCKRHHFRSRSPGSPASYCRSEKNLNKFQKNIIKTIFSKHSTIKLCQNVKIVLIKQAICLKTKMYTLK